jgi:hypothetical protein
MDHYIIYESYILFQLKICFDDAVFGRHHEGLCRRKKKKDAFSPVKVFYLIGRSLVVQYCKLCVKSYLIIMNDEGESKNEMVYDDSNETKLMSEEIRSETDLVSQQSSNNETAVGTSVAIATDDIQLDNDASFEYVNTLTYDEISNDQHPIPIPQLPLRYIHSILSYPILSYPILLLSYPIPFLSCLSYL